MTIADKFNYLNGTKEAIKNALIDKGVAVSASDSFRSYADKVASIETGGGSGAEIIEARCDPANFPVQAEKKVILAYTGEQPAAEKNLLAPFDYKTTWNNAYITPLQNSEYDFIMQNSSQSLAYKKEDEKYALTYLVSQTASTNAKLALGKYNLFLSQATSTVGYCLPKRFNRQAEIEDIIFDVEPDVPTGSYQSGYLNKVILPTYDDKYIWVFYHYHYNSAVATSQPKVYIYKLRYVEGEDKLYADKTAEYTQSVETTYPIGNAKQSTDDYTFLFEYSGRREWLQFNDETNTIEFKASSGSTTNITFLKKDWFINESRNVYTYELLADGTCSQTKTITLSNIYYMEPFEGVLWNRSNRWLVYDTIPTSDNIKEVQVTGVPYKDKIILEYDTTFHEIIFKKILDDGTIEDISVPDPYGYISFIDDEGRIRGTLKGSTGTTVTQPVDGSYTNGIQETSKISISGSTFVTMSSGHMTGIKNGKSLIYGYTSPKILKGFNSEVSTGISYQYYVFEDAIVFTNSPAYAATATNTKIVKITDDYTFIEYSNSGTLFNHYAFKINETYFFIAVNGAVYKVIFNEDALTYTSELLYQDSGLSFSSAFYPSSIINTKDGKYIIMPDAKKYFEISGTESEPQVQLKDFPEVLKTSLSTSIRFVQAFYDKSFGIQLNNGTYLMCRYDEGIDIDLSIEEYAPRLYALRNQTIMYYTQNKNYWMSYIYSSLSPNITAYAVGKGLTIPSHYKMTAFPNTSTYYNSDILTGFMTGEVVKEDETGSKIIKVRTALPEEEGVAPINYSDTVNCYVSGVALGQPKLNSTGTKLEPNSVCDIDVILTKVGYQALGDENFLPNPPTDSEGYTLYVRGITENGYIVAYTKKSPYAGASGYDIVDGVVDVSSKFSVGSYAQYGLPIFMNNGAIWVRTHYNDMTFNTDYNDNARFNIFSYQNNLTWSFNTTGSSHYVFLDFCFYKCNTSSYGGLYFFNDDLTYTKVEIGNVLGVGTSSYGLLVVGTRDLLYAFRALKNTSAPPEWEMYKLVRDGDTFVSTSLGNISCPSTLSYYSASNISVGCKQSLKIGDIRYYFLVNKGLYMCFGINEVDETQSTFEVLEYPDNIKTALGTRTIEKTQTFYDGTFSMDLSDGTTFICKFTDKYSVEILEVIEPFIIEDDETIYHRNFSENKVYWYLSGQYTFTEPLYYGRYNKVKSTVDWLAVPREQNRWNSSVLTGVIRQSAQLAKPVFDDTGRRVLQVETTIKKNNCDDATYKWTLEDYDKVNG